MENRIIELEMKFSTQELLLEQLSAVLYEQQKKIDLLERMIEEQNRTKPLEVGPHSVKPPHY